MSMSDVRCLVSRGALAVILAAGAAFGRQAETTHRIDIPHPAAPHASVVACELVMATDESGAPREYHADIDSVICGDDACEIVKVRLFWDALGKYKRFELPAGVALTKKDHETFTRKDYARLDSILADRGSILGEIPPSQIVSPEKAIDDVDAITGATPQTVADAVVPGAVYTCYTLWHWANGEISPRIRELSGRACPDELLLRYITEGDDEMAMFAMEVFGDRGPHGYAAQNAIIDRAVEGRAALARAAVSYLESVADTAGADFYYKGIEQLFAGADRQKRTYYLSALANTGLKAPAGFYDRLSRSLPKLDTYYEVHLLLELMEARNPASAEVTAQAMNVLTNDNFLIARRAFWFLEEQSLSPAQQREVETFRTTHESRL